MKPDSKNIISTSYSINDSDYRKVCKETLDRGGVLVLPDFIGRQAIIAMKEEAQLGLSEAYFCSSNHNVYLSLPDDNYPDDHPRNLQVISSKGLIGDDQLREESPLKQLYRDNEFRSFIAEIVGLKTLYPYEDSISCVNIHYAKEGQELGWHFDNSSFAITLLIDKPESGGDFEYLKDVRDADVGEMNFDGVANVLSGETTPQCLDMEPGTLVLFRGRNSMHRVTPTIGNKTRMLAVLAYNSEPGISLSENARMTFYGRLN